MAKNHLYYAKKLNFAVFYSAKKFSTIFFVNFSIKKLIDSMNEHEKTMEKKIFKNRVYVFLE